MQSRQTILNLDRVTAVLNRKKILDNVSLSIQQGEIVGIIGPSGQGKTTLLKTILMLLQPQSGSVNVFDVEITRCSEEDMKWVREQWGVMFQNGALFSSLTVLENIMFPIIENRVGLSEPLMQKIALFKIALVGLEKETGLKYPAELSGGMGKCVALARALALDPKLLFLDEPTAGLDPKSADDFDDLILRLHKDLGITVLIVTHDLDTLWRVPDRVVFIAEGKILAVCPMEELMHEKNPLIQDYLSGPRGQQQRRTARGG
ncbi:MAG: ABC transporter ATP-binding protein [Coxiella sp. RIFCSPHIGHO2_12_FULL_44_14]|nr:MAG: ABC transporter ATP-binding protein [Coxiella sp. RIFCSPHIGHO2_12_FULL_44_14]